MIYNKEFTEMVKREFREMSLTNPPAIDPKAIGMTYNILNKYNEDIHTSAVICLGIITHKFINYCYDNGICKNYYEVERILLKEISISLQESKHQPYKVFQFLMLLLFREETRCGNIPFELKEFLEKCDDIAIQYFSWYEDKAIKAGCLTRG